MRGNLCTACHSNLNPTPRRGGCSPGCMSPTFAPPCSTNLKESWLRGDDDGTRAAAGAGVASSDQSAGERESTTPCPPSLDAGEGRACAQPLGDDAGSACPVDTHDRGDSCGFSSSIFHTRQEKREKSGWNPSFQTCSPFVPSPFDKEMISAGGLNWVPRPRICV